MHDAFEWWSQITIPAAIGLLTLFVSAVALWVSHRSSLLAQAVEDQRTASERERREEDGRRELRRR